MAEENKDAIDPSPEGATSAPPADPPVHAAPEAVVDVADPDALDPEVAVPRGLEVYAALEAVLFAANQPMNPKRLAVLLNGVPEVEVQEAIEVLQRRYDDAGCGLQLMEVGGGWQMATRPEVSDWVLRLHKHRKRNPLTPSLLESLAIIAYKQPVTRSDVEAIRGVDCGTALRSLQDAGLVEVIGRKEVVGRPPLYGTTEVFLKTFGLKAIDDLPALTGGARPTLGPPAEEPPAADAHEPPAEPAPEATEPAPGDADDKPDVAPE